MQVEEALYKLLRDNDAVAAIVDDRIYPTILDREVDYPAIAYRHVPSGEHIAGLLGSSGLKRSRFRIFSTARKVASGYAVSIQLAEAVRLALQGFRGEVFHDTLSESVFIQNIIAESSHDLYDDKTETFQRAEDFDIWVQEPRPEFI